MVITAEAEAGRSQKPDLLLGLPPKQQEPKHLGRHPQFPAAFTGKQM